jgi:hypothetical protein
MLERTLQLPEQTVANHATFKKPKPTLDTNPFIDAMPAPRGHAERIMRAN